MPDLSLYWTDFTHKTKFMTQDGYTMVVPNCELPPQKTMVQCAAPFNSTALPIQNYQLKVSIENDRQNALWRASHRMLPPFSLRTHI